ncbi:hypothetical protein KW787_02420 [Candidatus Pacearchaeota archaeon]|nr:hypothetical protein [Candidatus Pacearchaeota archaeon]
MVKQNKTQNNSKITTIKLLGSTKARLEKLRSYKRETYDEILIKILEILTICKFNPERARVLLLSLDRKRRKAERIILHEDLS